MVDQADDAQKPQRRSAVLPPFFAPRQPAPTPPAQRIGGATRRRPSALFTPPGVPRQSTPARRATPVPSGPAPVMPRGSTPAAAAPSATTGVPTPLAVTPVVPLPSVPTPKPPATAAGADEVTGHATPSEQRDLVIEPIEPERVSLTVTAEQRAVAPADDIRVIGEEDSTPLLETQAEAGTGRSVDGVVIEDTEWHYDAAPTAALEVESFWAAEPLARHEADAEPERVMDAPSGELDVPDVDHLGLDAGDAAPPPGIVSDDARDAASSGAPGGSWGTWPAAGWSVPRETDDALADDAASASWRTQEGPAGTSADEYSREPAPALDLGSVVDETPVPPPAQASRGDELTAALDWPDADDLAHRSMSHLQQPVTDGAALDAVQSELRASAAPWAEEDPAPTVAEALERIARQIRDGAVVLPADAPADSDAGALAAALTALLRGRTR